MKERKQAKDDQEGLYIDVTRDQAVTLTVTVTLTMTVSYVPYSNFQKWGLEPIHDITCSVLLIRTEHYWYQSRFTNSTNPKSDACTRCNVNSSTSQLIL